MSRQLLLGSVLVAAILATAIGVVMAKYRSRTLFTALQHARAERGKLASRHAQLELEHSTWANVERVRQLARKSLDMGPPKHYHFLRDRP